QIACAVEYVRWPGRYQGVLSLHLSQLIDRMECDSIVTRFDDLEQPWNSPVGSDACQEGSQTVLPCRRSLAPDRIQLLPVVRSQVLCQRHGVGTVSPLQFTMERMQFLIEQLDAWNPN